MFDTQELLSVQAAALSCLVKREQILGLPRWAMIIIRYHKKISARQIDSLSADCLQQVFATASSMYATVCGRRAYAWLHLCREGGL